MEIDGIIMSDCDSLAKASRGFIKHRQILEDDNGIYGKVFNYGSLGIIWKG